MRVKMSHIIKSNEDIKNFSYLLEEFRKNENKDDIIYEIIKHQATSSSIESTALI